MTPVASLTYLATYCGNVVSAASLDNHAAIVRKLAYLMPYPWSLSHDTSAPQQCSDLLLDPTDDLGHIVHRSFVSCGALRVNEPPMDQLPNACMVLNHSRHALEVWSIAAIAVDQEVTMFYGKYMILCVCVCVCVCYINECSWSDVLRVGSGYYRDYLISQHLHAITNISLELVEHGAVHLLFNQQRIAVGCLESAVSSTQAQQALTRVVAECFASQCSELEAS
jgi:hypothetical protein